MPDSDHLSELVSSVRKCRMSYPLSRHPKCDYYCDDDNDDHVTVHQGCKKQKITTVKTLRFGSDSLGPNVISKL